MAPLAYYSTPAKVRAFTGIQPGDLAGLDTDIALDAELAEWLMDIKSLIDEYVGRDFALEEDRSRGIPWAPGVDQGPVGTYIHATNTTLNPNVFEIMDEGISGPTEPDWASASPPGAEVQSGVDDPVIYRNRGPAPVRPVPRAIHNAALRAARNMLAMSKTSRNTGVVTVDEIDNPRSPDTVLTNDIRADLKLFRTTIKDTRPRSIRMLRVGGKTNPVFPDPERVV